MNDILLFAYKKLEDINRNGINRGVMDGEVGGRDKQTYEKRFMEC